MDILSGIPVMRLAMALALSALLSEASAETERCPDAGAKALPMEILSLDKDSLDPARDWRPHSEWYATPIEPIDCLPLAGTPGPPDTPATFPALPSAIPVTSCDPGGCWDINGARYNTIGSRMVRSDGKVCQQIGAFLQCN